MWWFLLSGLIDSNVWLVFVANRDHGISLQSQAAECKAWLSLEGPDVRWALLAKSPYMAPVYKKRYLNGKVSTSLRLFSFLLLPCNKEIYFTWWCWKIFSWRIILWFDPSVSKTLKTRKWSCQYISSIHTFVEGGRIIQLPWSVFIIWISITSWYNQSQL